MIFHNESGPVTLCLYSDHRFLNCPIVPFHSINPCFLHDAVIASLLLEFVRIMLSHSSSVVQKIKSKRLYTGFCVAHK